MAIKPKPFYDKAFTIVVLGIAIILLTICGMFPWKCPIYSLFGIRCPGCGITRALICLIHGNFIEALQYNPTIYLIVIAFLLFITLFTLDAIKDTNRLYSVYVKLNSFLTVHRILFISLAVIYIVVLMLIHNL